MARPMTCPSPARIVTLVRKRLPKSILAKVIVGLGSKSLKMLKRDRCLEKARISVGLGSKSLKMPKRDRCLEKACISV